MKITKITSKTYNVKFYPGSWNMVHANFLESRRRHGMTTVQFERCFCCGKLLPLDSVPTFIQVDNGIGNRFACAECTKKETVRAGEET